MKWALPEWIYSSDIRPYLFVRKENRTYLPGSAHPITWFDHLDPIVLNPHKVANVEFANSILNLDSAAFNHNDMPTDRWVFYDCAVMPGIIAGFAMRREKIPQYALDFIKPHADLEWVPISLFITIPTAGGQWAAHNLSSLNVGLKKEDKLKGLGFLTKAYALWYGNIRNLSGMTQWTGYAMRLHSHFGNFEILTSYTPVHTYPETITYRTWVDSRVWHRFFTKQEAPEFYEFFEAAGFNVDPSDHNSLMQLQSRLESYEGPYYLSEEEIRSKEPGSILKIYKLRSKG